MPTEELRGSVNSVFLDFGYASESEHDLKTDKLSKIRPLTKNVKNRSNTSAVATGRRMLAGDDKLAHVQICKRKAKGYSDYHKVNTNVNHVHLQLNTIPKDVNQDFIFCKNDVKETPITTRATQTLYRESSAQTLPYLPEVKNHPEELKYSELFKLSEILPVEGPPGVYEVEILERARRRWAFADALKHNLRNDIDDVRKRLCQGKYKQILDNFAFEQWIEREEYIMECQMMRFEIVVRMFNQREKQLHEQSKKAIEHEHMKILAKRDAALLKNEIEYKRDMRRLDRKHNKQLNSWRDWRKERMSRQLGDPDSLYNAPQIRLGVNPNRRHYKPPGGRVFALNIPLDPNDVDMNQLECPFTKLSKWSEPKQRTQEIESNFLSDENLQKLYETLKSLRLQLVKRKVEPQCLKKRQITVKNDIPIESDTVDEEEESSTYEIVHSTRGEIRFLNISSKSLSGSRHTSRRFTQKYAGFAAHMRQEKHIKRHNFIDKRREEIECLLAAYEGKNIGWIMRLLGEELQRLQELRKLHTITILAQRERWRREAAEAGMRQKENEMRELFEELFRSMNSANSEACLQYFNDIFKPDVQIFANNEAEDQVTILAKQIDDDLQRWMEGIFCVQQPSTYDFLRYLLKELAFPNFERILHKTENKKVCHYILNEALFPKVYNQLEAFDISVAISNELVDRIIDNDLHYFSSDECLYDDSCARTCEVPEEVRESRALMRKLIRAAVPGRRWKTSTERIAYENFMDIVNEAFDAIDQHTSSTESLKCYGDLKIEPALFNLSKPYIGSAHSEISVRLSETPSKKLVYNEMSQFGDLCSIDSSHDIHKFHPQRFRSSVSTTYTTSETCGGSWNRLIESHSVVFSLLFDLICEIIIEDEPEERYFDQEENNTVYERSEQKMDTQSVTDSLNTLKELEETIEECLPQDNDVVEITESELIRLTDEKCKCEEERLKLNNLLRLIALGKVLIIRKIQSEVEVMSSGSQNLQLAKDEISEKLVELLEEEEQEYAMKEEKEEEEDLQLENELTSMSGEILDEWANETKIVDKMEDTPRRSSSIKRISSSSAITADAEKLMISDEMERLKSEGSSFDSL